MAAEQDGFWRSQRAVGVLFVTGVVGLLCLVLPAIGVIPPGWEPTASKLFLNLGSVLVTAVIATVFFNFRSVQEYLAGAVSTLLLQGDAVRRLSRKSQEDLSELILLESLSGNGDRLGEFEVDRVDQSLYEHLKKHERYYLSVPHRHNFHLHVDVEEDVEGDPTLVRKNYIYNYLVSCRHLKGGCGEYHLQTGSEISNLEQTVDPDEALIDFRVEVGETAFTKEDADVYEDTSGDTDVIVAELRERIEVEGETNVRIQRTTLSLRRDPTTIVYCRHPTKGFHARLRYRGGLSYDAAWFSSWMPMKDAPSRFPGGENNPEQDGIEAGFSGWLLPGDGVTLIHYPREPRGEVDGEGGG